MKVLSPHATACMICLLLSLPGATSAQGPLRVHPDNPRYFTDAAGKAIYVTGLHTWVNLQDAGPAFPPPEFNYDQYLDLLKTHNHNFTRLWLWESAVWRMPGSSGAWIDTLRFANRMKLAEILPTNDAALCSTRYCLRNPGKEYLVYQPETGPFDVDVVAGTYHFEWFDPSSRKTVETSQRHLTGGTMRFTPPFDGTAVLYLKAIDDDAR